MAHIQVDDRTPSVYYTVGGTPETDFVVPYAFFNDDDLDVYVDGVLKALTTHYTVTGAGLSDGGTVTFLVAQSNVDIAIIRDVPIERVTDFPASGPLDTNAINTEFDRQVAMMQQIVTEHERVVTLDPSDPDTNLVLPAVADRLGKILGFDPTTGDLLAIDPDDITLIVPTTASTIGKPMTGLLLSNNVATPNTKIDIAPGSARDKDQTVDIVLAAGLTKTTGAWVQGNDAGGLDAGSVAVSSAYHAHLIYNPGTAAVDVLFSLSADSPTMPSAAWTKRRRLPCGFLTDASGFIYPAVWRADRSIQLVTGPTVAANRSLLNSSLLSLGIPVGVKMKARCLLTITNAIDVGSPGFYAFFNDPDLGAPSTASHMALYKPTGVTFTGGVIDAWTDTSGRVYTGSASANDADNLMNVILQGWTDPLDEFA
jgi:hypothetical protein